MKKPCTAIILAGGKGERMGADTPKQYINLLGKPVLAHTVMQFESLSLVDGIILVVPANDIDYCRVEIKEAFKLNKILDIIPGGADRQESAVNGLKRVRDKDSVVMVHDGVRPFVSHEVIEKVYAAACENGAAITAVRSKDTIKVSDDGRKILKTLPREKLWAVQTPQAFNYELLLNAYELAEKDGFKATDDASVVEYSGHDVIIVEGSYSNIKITTIEDLQYSEYLLNLQ